MMKPVSVVRIVVAGAAAFSVLLYIGLSLPRLGATSFDDAYMFLRYAKHWLSGAGFSWNQLDGAAYGITSTLHLFAVTAVRGLTKLPDPTVLTSISFAAGLAFVAVVTIMGFGFFTSLRKYWLPLLVVPSVLLGPFFVFHSTTGMETTLVLLYNAIFTASVFYFAERRTPISLMLCVMAAYVSFLARPDTGLYGLLLPPLFMLADDTRQWRKALIYIAAFVTFLGLDLVFKRAIFGDFIPYSFFTKSSSFYRGFLVGNEWNAAHETFDFFRVSLPYLLVIALFTTRSTLRRLCAIFIPVVLTFAYLATMIPIMGWNSRYYYPTLPFLILGAFIAVNTYLRDVEKEQPRTLGIQPWRGILAFGILIVCTSTAVDHAATSQWRKYFIGELAPFTARTHYTTIAATPLPTLGWLRSFSAVDSLLMQLPRGVVLAASEYGYIGSRHPHITIIDLVGLHDRQVARYGFSADYLFSRKPDILWFPHSVYTWATKEILDSKILDANYDYYPSAYDYGLAVRRNSRFNGAIQTALEREFSRLYNVHKVSDYKATVTPGFRSPAGM